MSTGSESAGVVTQRTCSIAPTYRRRPRLRGRRRTAYPAPISRPSAVGAVVALLLAVAVLLSPASSAVAEDAPTTTTLTPRSLPRTDLELEARDNGNGGAQAPW